MTKLFQKLVGHNIYKFDLPYLIQSSVCNKVVVPDFLLPFGGKFRNFNSYALDTMDLAGAGIWGYMIKLETLARSLGYKGRKPNKGQNFYRLTREEQEEYLTEDLNMTKHVWKRQAISYGFDYDVTIFDIETKPLEDDKLEWIAPEFDPDSVAVANLKDPAKVEAKIQAAEINHIQSIRNKAGLHAHYSDPYAIGYIKDGETILDFGEPKELLEHFWEITAGIWADNKKIEVNY